MKKWTANEIFYLKKNYLNNYDKYLSKKLGRSLKSVSYMAYKLNLKKDKEFYCNSRKKRKINFNRELLKRLYYKEKKSVRKIAKELGVGKTTIEYYFKKFNIEMRTHSSANKIRFLNENSWSKGLTKDTDSRLKKLADKMKKIHSTRRQKKIGKIENEFGKPLKEILQDLYWKKKLNQYQIADRFEMDRSIVIELMKKLKISKRPNYQYIASLKGEKHPLYGKTWELHFGKEEAQKRKKSYAKRFRNLTIKRLKNGEFPFFDTIIERIMARELIKRKIPFVKQFNVDNKFVCDFAIPSLRIIIECDGDYWHANPKLYSSNELYFSQKRNLQRDKFKDKYLVKKGWKVLRFFESEIKEDIKKCGDKIEKLLIHGE